MNKKRIIGIVVVLAVLVVAVGLIIKFALKDTEDVSGEGSETEVTLTPEPTPEEKENPLLENGNLVFRYEEDKELLSQLSDENNETTQTVINGILFEKNGETVFREEEKQADILYAGTVFVPRDVECSELVDIVSQFSYPAYLKYQKEYPETKSEFSMFMGEAEADLYSLEYSEYDHLEYKKLVKTTVWKDDSFAELSFEGEFIVVVDICFK